MQTLFVWDFDNTIVLDNTDQLAIEKLQPDLLESHLKNRELVKEIGWTEVMNLSLSELARRGFTPTDILDAVSKCHFPDATLQSLQTVASHPQASNAIVSDSNTEFIRVCLENSNATDLFADGIFTNLGVVRDEKVIQVVPYTTTKDAPHTCISCPSNLCKGVVLNNLIEKRTEFSRVVYIGDGSNDFCAALQLRPADIVLFRKGFSLERKINRASASLQATPIGWNSPEELRQLVSQWLT